MSRVVRFVAWCGLLAGVGWVAATVPVGPSLGDATSLTAVREWADTATADEMAAALLRYGLLLTVCWFGLITVGAGALRCLGARDLALALTRWLPAAARSAVRPAVAGALAVTVTASSFAAVSAQTTPSPTTTSDVEQAPTAVLTHVGTGWPDLDYPTSPGDLTPAVAEPAGAASPNSTTTPAVEWTVQSGDHLWSIAERTAPAGASLRDIGRHWLDIIELNRAALPDPSNPDLIFPDMVVQIPPLPAPKPGT